MRARRVSMIGLFCLLAAGLPRPAAPAATARTVLPFIVDDYARAVAEAKARKVPIFIESWAPW